MAVTDWAWNTYPWGASTNSDSITIYPSQWGSSSGTWYGSTTIQAQIVPQVEAIAEKVESAMDWLRRRVTEITDLAYAEV